MLNFKKAHRPGARPGVSCVFALTALLVCLLIIYWPAFRGDWYLDDFGNIHENPNVHLQELNLPEITKSFYGMSSAHGSFKRPLSYLTLALNYYFGGVDPFGYHVVNFGIHFGSTVFLFLLTLNILRLPSQKATYAQHAGSIALLSAFLWASHPIQVNAVTYIVQRMSALAGLFTILTLYCYLKGRMSQLSQTGAKFVPYGWYTAGILAGGCALASKQNAAMLPFSLLLMEILLIQTAPLAGQIRRLLKILLPTTLVFILLVFVLGGFEAVSGGYQTRPFTLVERVLTQPRVICFYIGQLLYPSGAPFTLLHDFTVSTSLLSPWTTLPAILLLLLAVGFSLWFASKWPLVSFSYLFFLLNHAIEGSILPLELVFEHRNYLPTLFFFLPPAIGCFKAAAHFSYAPLLRGFLIIGIGVWLVGQSHTTYTLNRLFQHPVAFWTNNVELYPNLHRPRHNLGKSLLIYGKVEEGEAQMYRSLSGKSSGRTTHKFITHYNLGVYYLHTGAYRLALNQFSTILNASPNHVQTLQKMAELYLESGHNTTALDYIEKALSQSPPNPTLHVTKGFILLSLGKIDAAFSAAAPADHSATGKLGAAYIRGEGQRLKRNYSQAIGYFEKVVRLDRHHYAALLSLAELYYLTGQHLPLDDTLGLWLQIASDEKKEVLLADYDRRWNFVGSERMRTLSKILMTSKESPARVRSAYRE